MIIYKLSQEATISNLPEALLAQWLVFLMLLLHLPFNSSASVRTTKRESNSKQAHN